MMEMENKNRLNILLSDLADQLDVPPSKYEDAKKRYDAVGNWLKQDDSELAPYDPDIYPQGSFALGTVVRPLNDEDYDLDVVCLLKLAQNEISQQRLKEMVGDRLKANDIYVQMLDPKEGGRRCWRLKYADSSRFHLDILPAIPDGEYGSLLKSGIPRELSKHAICITDKKCWFENSQWPKSNPKGYAEWFKKRMQAIFDEQKRLTAIVKKAEIEQIPDYEIRTPLQRVIQLLKRHRDMRYGGDEDKPISVIITTLAALTYSNEKNLVDALLNIVPSMRRAIKERNGILWVPNPINGEENFADKWAESPRKASLFFEWLDAVENEHRELLTDQGIQKVGEYFTKSYGQREASAVMAKSTSRNNSAEKISTTNSSSINMTDIFDVPHRVPPKWPVAIQYRAKIEAHCSGRGFESRDFHSNSKAVPKCLSLKFSASTDAPQPFDIYWQVVNTGSEAAAANDLRGQIFDGVLAQPERTFYSGTHCIRCFIVKGKYCVAKSKEFIVNIM